MKKLKIILFLCFSFFGLNTVRSQGLVDSISASTCNCISALNIDNMDKEKLTMELGFCMMRAAEPYHKQLKNTYGIDLDKAGEAEGEKLGRLVGMKLAGNCPGFTALLTKLTAGDPDKVQIEGTIVDFIQEQFVTIVLKDSDGRDVKILWLDYFKNSENLLDKGKNKNVTIEYEERELYSPKMKDYIKFKVATNILFDI